MANESANGYQMVLGRSQTDLCRQIVVLRSEKTAWLRNFNFHIGSERHDHYYVKRD